MILKVNETSNVSGNVNDLVGKAIDLAKVVFSTKDGKPSKTYKPMDSKSIKKLTTLADKKENSQDAQYGKVFNDFKDIYNSFSVVTKKNLTFEVKEDNGKYFLKLSFNINDLGTAGKDPRSGSSDTNKEKSARVKSLVDKFSKGGDYYKYILDYKNPEVSLEFDLTEYVNKTTEEGSTDNQQDTTTEKLVQKSNGKWVNRGKDGQEHGEFDTKSAAEKQMKAMYASGFKGESLNESDKELTKDDVDDDFDFSEDLDVEYLYTDLIHNYGYGMESDELLEFDRVVKSANDEQEILDKYDELVNKAFSFDDEEEKEEESCSKESNEEKEVTPDDLIDKSNEEDEEDNKKILNELEESKLFDTAVSSVASWKPTQNVTTEKFFVSPEGEYYEDSNLEDHDLTEQGLIDTGFILCDTSNPLVMKIILSKVGPGEKQLKAVEDWIRGLPLDIHIEVWDNNLVSGKSFFRTEEGYPEVMKSIRDSITSYYTSSTLETPQQEFPSASSTSGNEKIEEGLETSVEDMIEGSIDNSSDDRISSDLKLYKKISKVLKTDEKNLKVYIVDYDEDFFSYGEQISYKEVGKVSNEAKQYIINDSLDLVRELLNGSIYLYFKNEEDLSSYKELINKSSLEEDVEQDLYKMTSNALDAINNLDNPDKEDEVVDSIDKAIDNGNNAKSELNNKGE